MNQRDSGRLGDELGQLLSAYFDGEATPDERAAAERLLAARPECRRYLAELGAVRAALRAADAGGRQAGLVGRGGAPVWRRRPVAALGLALAIAAMLLAAFWLGTWRTQLRRPEVASAPAPGLGGTPRVDRQAGAPGQASAGQQASDAGPSREASSGEASLGPRAGAGPTAQEMGWPQSEQRRPDQTAPRTAEGSAGQGRTAPQVSPAEQAAAQPPMPPVRPLILVVEAAVSEHAWLSGLAERELLETGVAEVRPLPLPRPVQRALLDSRLVEHVELAAAEGADADATAAVIYLTASGRQVDELVRRLAAARTDFPVVRVNVAVKPQQLEAAAGVRLAAADSGPGRRRQSRAYRLRFAAALVSTLAGALAGSLVYEPPLPPNQSGERAAPGATAPLGADQTAELLLILHRLPGPPRGR